MSEDNLELIWQNVIQKLGEVLTYHHLEAWIKPLHPVSIDKKTLTVAAKNNISKEYVYKNSHQIINILKEITGKKLEFKIIVDEKMMTLPESKPSNSSTNYQQAVQISSPFLAPPKQEEKFSPLKEFQINALKSTSNNLNLKYNFENFVVGTHNKFAHAAALAVAKEPAKNHNPLFIYGGAGLGKTHLMQAIGHYILVHHPHLKIKFTSTESFTNDLINSIRGGNDKMTAFRQRYRQVDILMIDDIQFIESKTSTQEEIFHTFDFLHSAGKQIILTSDRPPKSISTLTERLRSRFEWGLLVDIQVPDIETRIAILKNKVEMDGMDVPDQILEIIATAYQNNIRELEGALNRVVAYVSINDLPMTIDTVSKIINFSGVSSNLTIDKIIEITGGYYGVEPSEIKGQSRSKEISQARQTAIYLSRDMTGASFPTIGQAFGGRKHTTILYSFEKMKEEIQVNKLFGEAVSEISKRITHN